MSSLADISCPKCHTLLSVTEGQAELTTTCPHCQSTIEAYFFPAFHRAPEAGVAAATLINPEEASCFYHPQKQAAYVCDACGRMVCSLCAIELGADRLCPACFSAGRKKAAPKLVNERVRYDNVALLLAAGSFFLSFFAIITAPAAIYIAIRYWNRSGGVNGSSRARNVLAVIIAGFAFCFWAGMIAVSIYGGTQASAHHHRVQ
jgi:hypothetical protein